MNYKSQSYSHSMGECLEKALLFQILAHRMKKKKITKKLGGMCAIVALRFID